MIDISVTSNAIRNNKTLNKIGELFDLRFRQVLAQEMQKQDSTLPLFQQALTHNGAS